MKGKIFTAFFTAFMLVVLWCSCAYALSDAEYTQMMKDSSFAQADRQLTRAYRDALNSLKNSKTAQDKFKQDQRQWIASGRDEDAEAMMKRYSRTRAYTMATRARAEDIPEIAKKYLQESQSSSRRAQASAKQDKQAQSSATETDGYPMLGMCTGNNVRLRDNPGTKSNVIGAANNTDILILLGVRYVGGDAWYVVDNPTEQGTAWISGQYIDPDKGDSYGTPAYTMALQVMMNFGMTIQKAKSLWGNPESSEHEKYYSDLLGRNAEGDTLNYDGFNLHYLDVHLTHVDVSKKGYAFGSLQVGDSEQKMRSVLGNPSGEGDEGCTYEISELESLQFELRNGVITVMEWNHYLD